MNGKEKKRRRLLAFALLGLLSAWPSPGQTVVISVAPDADAFLRSAAPTNNYGAGGALSVSGSAALNGSGFQNGLLDSLIRFPMTNVVALLNGSLGNDWVLTQARLVVTETAAPDNDLFNRGTGAFEIRWLASDNWLEGTGTPIRPATNGVTWQNLPQLLNSNLDVTLGAFTNSGVDTQESFIFTLADRFVNDLRLGVEISLYLTAQSPSIGFTFNSRNFGNTNTQPALVITAAANPRPWIDSIQLQGTNVAIRFTTISNWTYSLQSAGQLSASLIWSNLLAVPAQPVGSNVTFLDSIAPGQKLYRLSVAR